MFGLGIWVSCDFALIALAGAVGLCGAAGWCGGCGALMVAWRRALGTIVGGGPGRGSRSANILNGKARFHVAVLIYRWLVVSRVECRGGGYFCG